MFPLLLNRIAWLAVGGLFIFSGLIKLNDPVGTAIKLEEYFEVFSSDFSSIFHVFTPYALYLSIFLSTLEVGLGVALLARWRVRLVLWLLLGLTLFFTWLTFYSAYYNKVTDCGCFGDVIKLTPWQSFSKDVLLLVLLVILLFTIRFLPSFQKNRAKTAGFAVAMAFVLAAGMGIYAYLHDPYLDFRAYKVGANLPALMKASAPLRYTYIMEKNGRQEIFNTYPTDTTYLFKKMVPQNPEDGPKITDFNVWNDQGDFTAEILQQNRLLVVVHSVTGIEPEAFQNINNLLGALEKNQSPKVVAVALTSSNGQEFDAFRHEVGLAIPFFYADATVLKTMIRSNPGLMLLQNGVVVGKWHFNDVPSLKEMQELL